jgi:hypothetical protein
VVAGAAVGGAPVGSVVVGTVVVGGAAVGAGVAVGATGVAAGVTGVAVVVMGVATSVAASEPGTIPLLASSAAASSLGGFIRRSAFTASFGPGVR